MKIITVEDAIKELKNQIVIGSVNLLVGDVNVEYDNQMLVTVRSTAVDATSVN